MDRKDMLLAEAGGFRPPQPKRDVQTLTEVRDEGASYLELVETRGWKLLLKKFLEPRSSVNRILSQPGGRSRDEATAAVAELVELKNYVEGRIKEGLKAHEELKALKE